MSGSGPVPSLIVGTSDALMRAAAELYIAADDVVVDVTYGRGVFWRQLPGLPSVAHDIRTDRGDGVDCRALPEADGSVDVLVFDPPFRLNGNGAGAGRRADDFLDRFGLVDCFPNTQAGMRAMQGLYRDGIAEAARVLAPRGRLMVKCQDLILGRRLIPMAFEVGHYIEAVGLKLIDLFVLHSGGGPDQQWKTQQRARRTHSYLLVASQLYYWRPDAPKVRTRAMSQSELEFTGGAA